MPHKAPVLRACALAASLLLPRVHANPPETLATQPVAVKDEYVRDCSASDAERLAPLEAAVARHSKRGRIDRDRFVAEWRKDGDPAVIRIERGECDGETHLIVSGTDNAPRLEQQQILIALAARAWGDAYRQQLEYLFQRGDHRHVTSDQNGATLLVWSGRHTVLFPHGAFLSLGPEEARLTWMERADPRFRKRMLDLIRQEDDLRAEAQRSADIQHAEQSRAKTVPPH